MKKRNKFICYTIITSVFIIYFSPIVTARGDTIHKNLRNNNKIIINWKNPYIGPNALHYYENIAKKNEKNITDQINAGVSAFQNKLPNVAIYYYNKAEKLDSKNGVILNDIGNVYRDGLHNDKKAIFYYKKAISIEPSYDFSWLNLVYTLNQMNMQESADTVVLRALKILPKSDPLYNIFKKILFTLKK